MKKTALRLGKRLLAFSIVAVLVALTACGGGAAPPASSAPPASKPPVASSAAPVSTAKVVVVLPPVKGPPVVPGGKFLIMPKDGATVESNTIYSQVDYANINIMPGSSTNKEGEGHVNFYLDVDPIPIEAGKPAILPSPLPTGYTGKIFRGWDTATVQQQAYIWKGVPNGNHTFAAQLVQNDDTPFNPPIWGKAAVVIKGEFPGGTPTVLPAKTKASAVKATITSFTPTSGGAGTKVTITGKDFDVITIVQFGDTSAADFDVNSATQITAIVGSGASGKITIVNPNGVTVSNDTFTFK